MTIITRRAFLKGAVAGAVSAIAGAAHAFGFAPLMGPRVTRHIVAPKSWPADADLEIAALSDLHACDPWMSLDHIAYIVERTNALRPDIIVLLGDYVSGLGPTFATPIPAELWARELSRLSAPLGVHAILGNHDFWDDTAGKNGAESRARHALQESGIPVYENSAVRLKRAGRAFWLAGLGDQHAIVVDKHGRRSRADLPATLAEIETDDPLILMAHEPDVFAAVPDRVDLTLCGHTHGGQVRLLGWAPIVPSRFGSRYLYGHIVEDERHLVVSGGLGCTALPVRFGAPPEIVHIRVTSPAAPPTDRA